MNSKKRTPRHNLLSIEPFNDRKTKSFEDLPSLNKSFAQSLILFGVGLLLTLSFLLFSAPSERLPNIFFDPWTIEYLAKGDLGYLVAWALLIVFTAGICLKQYGYYYFERGQGKYGIFTNLVKQVNYREQTFDVFLAIIGILLIPATIYPIIWFLLLSVYAIFVVCRCFFTASREGYARKLEEKNVEVPEWYYQFEPSMYKEYANQGYKAKCVMIGWVVTEGFIAAYSFIAFLFLGLAFELIGSIRIPIFVVLWSVAVCSYYNLGDLTYEWAERLCDDQDSQRP